MLKVSERKRVSCEIIAQVFCLFLGLPPTTKITPEVPTCALGVIFVVGITIQWVWVRIMHSQLTAAAAPWVPEFGEHACASLETRGAQRVGRAGCHWQGGSRRGGLHSGSGPPCPRVPGHRSMAETKHKDSSGGPDERPSPSRDVFLSPS